MKLAEVALLGGLAYLVLGQRSDKAPSADSMPNNTPQGAVSIPAGTSAGNVVVTQPISSAQQGVDYINSQILNKTPKTVTDPAAKSGGIDSYKQTVGGTTVNFTKKTSTNPKLILNKYGRKTILQNGASKKGYS